MEDKNKGKKDLVLFPCCVFLTLKLCGFILSGKTEEKILNLLPTIDFPFLLQFCSLK